MSLRKWNDSKGWSRGAAGIDDAKGAESRDFVHPYRDRKAEMRQFGRCWLDGADFGGRADPAEYSGKTDTKAWSESEDYDAPGKSGPSFP